MKIKKFKLPHNTVEEGSSVEGNEYFLKNLRNILKLLGANIVDPGFHFSAPLFLAIFMSHILMSAFFYMLFTDVPLRAKLEAFCVAGALFQGVHKLYVAALCSDEFQNLVHIVRSLHAKYEKHPDVAPTLKKICVYSILLIEILAVAFLGAIMCFLLMPVFLWTQYGIFTTIFPIHFPFIDWHTTLGYTINTIDHAYCVIIGITGVFAGDAGFLHVILHSIGFLEIFRYRVGVLDKMLLEPGPQDKEKIQEQFNVCIRAHQEYMAYIDSVDQLYAQLCMSQLITSEIMLTTGLLLTLWVRWIIGPFMAFVGLCQILEYCILGTVVTVQNDKASGIIYGFSWYLLPVDLQKSVVLMILRGQHSPEVSVGPFAKLNVETCMKLLKATYTFIMMILEFLS